MPPTTPTLRLSLAVEIAEPSVDPEGNPVTYTIVWESNDGYRIEHHDVFTIGGRIMDAMEQSEKIKFGQTWTVTVTPNDGFQDGPSAQLTARITSCGTYWLMK